MEPRQPLNLLADETGGRTIVRSSDLDKDLIQAVAETSDYYLLAWRPTNDIERNGKARLQVSIAGQPDLRVRLRRAYYVPAAAAATKAAAPEVSPEAQLLRALGSAQPVGSLPTYLSVGYARNADGSLALQASMQSTRAAFNFDNANKSIVDVIGAAIDDRGLIYTFKQVLTVTPVSGNEIDLPVIWHQKLTVQPGLYQAAPARLNMSSVFLGERRDSNGARQATEPQSIPVEADRSFARSSVLRFQMYLYDAVQTEGKIDVWVDARLSRAGQPVLIISPNKVPAIVKDLSQLPYWSEIGLAQLPPGSYMLEISATDRISGAVAAQRVRFSVE